MKINAKLRLSFLALGLVPLAITGVVCYQIAWHGWVRATVGQLEGLADAKERRLAMTLEQNADRLALVASRTQLRELLQAFLLEPDETQRLRMRRILEDARRSVRTFETVSALNLEGTVVASTDDELIGVNLGDEPFFFNARETARVDSLRVAADGQPYFILAGPLRSPASASETLGVLVIRANATELLAALRERHGLGETGETMLVQADPHGNAVVLAPLRHDPTAAFQRVIARAERESPALLALAGQEGVLRAATDYRGVRVLAATRFLPGAGWGLVVQVDRAEALAPLFWLRNLSLLALALTLLAITCAALRLSRSITKPIVELTETAARISAGDLARRAVARSGDEIGLLARSFNDMAESLTEANRGLEEKVAARTLELEREVAERRATETLLERERNRLRTLIDNSPDLIYVKDTASRFVVANLAVARLVGARSPDELLGRTDAEFFPAEFAAAFSADETAVFRDGRALLGKEEPVVDATRGERWFSTSKVPLRDASGAIVGLVGVGRDITEHRVAEQALHRAEAKYRLLVEQLPAVTYIAELGPHGRWLYVSPQIQTLLGYTPDEWTATPERWLAALHPDDRARVLAEEERAAASREPFLCEYRLLARDGREVWVRDTAAVVRDAPGGVEQLHGVLFDVTERKRAEAELQRAAAALERSNHELEVFAYVASHDLQEPLRAVAGCVQILEKRYRAQLDDHAVELLGHIVAGAQRMQALITGLLAYSRVDRGRELFSRVDCEQAFAEALANLATAIAESGAVVEHDPLPEVAGDPTQLLQLFQNLLGNALKYHAAQVQPRVRVSVARQGNAWQFAVRDNGIGIEARYFERIFGIFQRLHTREEYPGAGIGLALCQKIVERHGGKIWVESTPGHGTTFLFTLPVAAGEARTSNDSHSVGRG